MSDEIDINDLQLQDEVVETDEMSAAEWNARSLPDDDWHLGTFTLGQDGVRVGTQEESKGGKHYLKAHVAIALQDSDGKGEGSIFDRVNSVIIERNGKKSSGLHALMDALGEPVPARISVPDFFTQVEYTFATSPQAEVRTQWQASSKAESQEEVDKAIAQKFAKPGKLQVGWYYTFLKGQKKFPPIAETGKYSPEVANPITGVVEKAQAVPIEYRRKG